MRKPLRAGGAEVGAAWRRENASWAPHRLAAVGARGRHGGADVSDDTRPCCDCNEVGGLGWWRGRIAHPGSAGPRCHGCYLEYQNARIRPRKPAPRKPAKSRECRACGATFTSVRPAKYCSAPCKHAAANAARRGTPLLVCPCGKPTMREDGLCQRCHSDNEQIDGLCSPWPCLTHITYAKCLACSGTFVDRDGGGEFCSSRCRIRFGRITPIGYGRCVRCDATFLARKPWQIGSFCSDRCRSAVHNARRDAWKRASRRGKQGTFTLRQIAERDGWRCHLCDRRVPDQPFANRPDDPTIDHLIPLSLGGVDEPLNVALAHFRCNTLRGARGIVQLRLVG